ncbi:MAG: elongation factor 1-beta [Candidatus ainarchaeum sp.]|nr:elongation factor 1-beta [Candidatus ainarchaeum sp.]
MGDILTVYKLYPEEIEDSDKILEAIKTTVPEDFKLNSMELEPIAFGLKIVKVSFIFPDKIGGLLEKLEEYLKSIPGVNEIEPASTTLI